MTTYIEEIQKPEHWYVAAALAVVFFIISNPFTYNLTASIPGLNVISNIIGHTIVFLILAAIVISTFSTYGM